jgi:transcriptional regulator with XRE-family HTH domain
MNFKEQSDFVRQRMEELGIKQVDLCRETSMSAQHVHSLMSNKCGVPSGKIKQFAKTLKCPATKIVKAKVLDYEKKVLREVNQ